METKNQSDFPLFVKLCSDKAAFKAQPKQRLRLNMDEVKKTLEESSQHQILVHTPHIIIVRSGKAETTLSRDGTMLIKRVANEAEATQLAHQLLDAIRFTQT